MLDFFPSNCVLLQIRVAAIKYTTNSCAKEGKFEIFETSTRVSEICEAMQNLKKKNVLVKCQVLVKISRFLQNSAFSEFCLELCYSMFPKSVVVKAIQCIFFQLHSPFHNMLITFSSLQCKALIF